MTWKKLVFSDEAISTADALEQGDVLYYDGSVWKKLAPGTAGQLLQTGGAGANPSWVDSSGATGEKVKADSSDPTAGYLVDKVDGTTILEDGTNHYIKLGIAKTANMDIDANLEFNYHQLLHAVAETGTTLPSTGSEVAGQFFYNSSDGHMYVFTA